MHASRHFNYLSKVLKMVCQGSKHDTIFLLSVYTRLINYVNVQEGCPYFLMNHFIHLDYKQFVKISHETIAPWPLFPHIFITGLTGIEYHSNT